MRKPGLIITLALAAGSAVGVILAQQTTPRSLGTAPRSICPSRNISR
jgi:hypothetical protein